MYKNEKTLFKQTALAITFLLVLSGSVIQDVYAQDSLRNLPELSLPLLDNNIIKAYFKVADAKNIDFKLTLCFSHPGEDPTRTTDSKIAEWSRRVNSIMRVAGHNNKHWLRTPDGRLIVYMWYGEQIIGPDSWKGQIDGYATPFWVAQAYRKIANNVGEKFACMFSTNEKITPSSLDNYLDYFPAVWMWTNSYTFAGLDVKMNEACKKRKRTFMGTAFPDFYTSKIMRPDPVLWDILWLNDALAVGNARGLQRKYMATGLSNTFRQQLEYAVKLESPIINIITWNDYPEGHHLAPEVNHNDGFTTLLKYYKSIWKGESSPFDDRDVAIAFFKKYKRGVTPSPYNYQTLNVGTVGNINVATEDSIDIVTILAKPGKLKMNGEIVDVPAGLTSTKFKSQPGAVNVSVMRDGKETATFKTPEWITDKPLRTDLLTYSFSSEFPRYFKDIFGNIPPIYSTQYNKEVNK
ncbi:MAG: hypothetical protein HY305_01615 [Sphingobacteriales bacterium]|nr:hypothetical protein [Sphingobacteriales bacterium]